MVKGRHRQQRRPTRPARQRRPVPAQPRWPADHAASRRLGVRPAQGQPRGDRRVPDRHQHVRHHAGPVDRDAGAGDLPLGHQRPARRRPMGSSATTASTPPTRSPNKVLPFENQQVGGTLGGPIIREQDALLRRPTSTSGSRTTAFLAPTRLPNQTFAVRDQADQQELSRPGRLSAVVDGHASRSAASAGRSTTRSDRERHGASVDAPSSSGSDSTNVFGTWTHVVSSNLMMQVHGGYNGFSWFNDAIPSNDVQFHNTPFFVPEIQFPGLTLGGQRNYPNYTWQDTYSGRAGCELAPGTTRDEVRRRVSAGQGHEGLVPEPARHLRVLDPAVGRRAGAPLPGRRLEQPGALGHQRPRAVPAALRHQLPPGLPRRHAAADAGAVVRRQLAASPTTCRVNLGVRYDADWGATNPPCVTDTRDPDRQRRRVARLRLQDRHPRPQQRRAAGRLCL